MADIIIHTNHEAVLGLRLVQVVEARLHHGRSEVLASQTDLSSHNRSVALQLVHRRHHIQVQRLTGSSVLSAAVQHADALAGLGDRSIKVLAAEGAEEMYLHHSHLLSLLVQVVHRLLHGGSGTHHNDHTISVLGSGVVEQVVLTTRDAGNLVHSRLHLIGSSIVEGLRHDAVLHVDILRLGNSTLVGVVGVQSTLSEVVGSLVRIDLGDLLARNTVDRVHLVRNSPSIEEVEEGNARRDGRQVRHQSQIVSLLHAVRRHDSPSRLAGSHHIRVLAQQRQSLLRHHTRRHVNNGRQQTSSNTVHVGDHQHHTLRGREGGSEQSTHQSSVKGTSSTSLRL